LTFLRKGSSFTIGFFLMHSRFTLSSLLLAASQMHKAEADPH
jgi:hypothetical protein